MQSWQQWVVGLAGAAALGLLTWNLTVTQNMAVRVAVIEATITNYDQSNEIGLLSKALALLEYESQRQKEWTSNLSKRLADVESTIRNSEGRQ